MPTIEKNIKYLEYLLIILLTSYLYLPKIDLIKFHPDESTWITTSLYFDEFIKGNTDSPIWDPGYWTLTQPPVTRYIIGIARKLKGIGPEGVNKPWDYRLDGETNIQNGAMPSPELLTTARTPMVIMAILSIFLLFYGTRKHFGILTAYLLFILIAFNNYLTTQLSRAMSESPLLLFIILVIFMLFLAVRYVISNSKPITNNKNRFIALSPIIALNGIMIGITAGIKLNGFALLGVVMILFVVLLFFSAYLKNLTIKFSLLLITCLFFVLSSASFSTFISYNPFLYNNTFERTVALFKWRLHEMKNQANESESTDLTRVNFTKRAAIVGNNIFNKYSTISFKAAFILNMVLSTVGFIFALNKSAQFLRGSTGNLAFLLLVLSFIFLAGPSLLTPLDWDRYFYLPVIFTTVFIAIGTAELFKFIYYKLNLDNFTTPARAHS